MSTLYRLSTNIQVGFQFYFEIIYTNILGKIFIIVYSKLTFTLHCDASYAAGVSAKATECLHAKTNTEIQSWSSCRIELCRVEAPGDSLPSFAPG